MTKICLTCKVSKSMNIAELEKVIPDWYKEIGNYSLLPPILNNNDKYNAKKTTLQVHKPNITNYEVKVDIIDKRNTWICYWAANYTDKYDKIKTAKEAYDKFQNHGLVKTNSSGKAVLTLNCPQPYSVDGITYPRHVHYCLLKKDNFWSDDIKTVIVSCDIDFKTMKKFVDDKCHLIVNALAKESYDRCKIPGSINIPVLHYQKQNAIDVIKKALNDFDKLKKFKNKKIYEVPIVVYCSNTECKASEKLIELLIDSGFRNLLEYSEGIKGWMLKSSREDKKDCVEHIGGDPTSSDTYENIENKKKVKKSSSKSDDRKFNLSLKMNKIVIVGKDSDKIYKHNLENNEVSYDGDIVGKYKDGKIEFIKNEEESKPDTESDTESETESDSDTDSDIESDKKSSEYKKDKVKIVCKDKISQKTYDKEFRGWIFTLFGNDT